MPWKGLRPRTAGGRKSRRHSFLEKRDFSSLDGEPASDSAEQIARQINTTENRPITHRSLGLASADPAPGQETPDTDNASNDIPQRLRREDASTVPRSHRFSLLRFRHASDPQLSRSYATSESNLSPPLSNQTSKYSTWCLSKVCRRLTLSRCQHPRS